MHTSFTVTSKLGLGDPSDGAETLPKTRQNKEFSETTDRHHTQLGVEAIGNWGAGVFKGGLGCGMGTMLEDESNSIPNFCSLNGKLSVWQFG
jgi:hypothetical protein